MLNKKIMILTVILVSLFAVSAVSAADNATSDVVSVEETTDEVVTVDNDNQVIAEGNASVGSFAELQTEINNIEESGVLNLTKDYKYINGSTEGISINKPITIDGQGHIIDGNYASRIFYIGASNVVLKNFNIKNGKSLLQAGAIFWYCDNGSLINCNITNCLCNPSSPDTNTVWGGALYCSFNGNISVVNCNFINNSAYHARNLYSAGGAIYLEYVVANIINCTFENNFARWGCALNNYQTKSMNVVNCTFFNNHGSQEGALSLGGSNNIISNCIFINNSAEYQGGAIYVGSGNNNISYCNFSNNFAESAGGAIELSNSYNSFITHCNFVNNYARPDEGNGFGNSIMSVGSEDCLIKDCTFYPDLFNIDIADLKGVEVIKTKTSLSCGNIIGFYNMASNFSALLKNAKNMTLNNKKIIFIINNAQLHMDKYTDYYGIARICNELSNLTVGTWNVTVLFEGDDNYAPCNATATITVLPVNSSVIVDDVNASWDSQTTFTAHVLSNNTPINEGTVSFYIGDEFIGDAPVNAGVASLTHEAPGTLGEHDIAVIFNSNNYLSSNNTAKLLVNSGDMDVSQYENVATFKELSGLIENTPEGGILILTKDYIYVSGSTEGIQINKPITIDGQGHSIDGNQLSKMFKINVDNVTLKNINFKDTYGDINLGAPIEWQGNNGLMHNCTFKNIDGKSKSSCISAIHYIGDNGVVEDCSFINITSIFYGSILWEGNGGNLINCDFINHTSSVTGAICWRGANGNLTNNNFVNNYVYSSAGAVSIECENITLTNSIFINNSASSGDGGAINWYSVGGSIIGCSFINNSASNYGGAINWYGASGSVVDCHFTNNIAYVGGAIYCSSPNGTLINCTFENNGNSMGSGAVNWCKENGKIINCNFTNNYAYQDGGAIGLSDCVNASIVDCLFVNNTSINGAITGYNSDYAEIVNCLFVNQTDYAIIIYGNYVLINHSFFHPDLNYGYQISGYNSTIIKPNTQLISDNILFYYNNSTNFSSLLNDDANNALVDKNIIFNFNGRSIIITTNDMGVANLKDELNFLDVGSWNVTVIFEGTSNYASCNTTATITVLPPSTSLTIDNVNATVGHEVTLVANVNSTSTINEGVVTFYDGETNIGEANVYDGVATLTYTPATAGNHTITAGYASENYQGVNTSAVLSVSKANVDLSIGYIESVYFTAPSNFAVDVNSNYKPVNEGEIKFYVNDVLVGSSSVYGGTANFNYVTNATGSFTLTAAYNETDNYLAANTTSYFYVNQMPTTLTGESIIFDEQAYKTFTTELKDNNNNGVDGQPVKIEVIKYSGESATFDGVSDSNGITIYDVGKLAGGMWYVTGIYAGDGNYIGSSFADKFIVVRMDTTTDIEDTGTPQVNHNYKIKANIHDENGKLVKEGIVQFYLDGVDIGSVDLSENQGHQSALANGVLGAVNPMFEYSLGAENDVYLNYIPTKAGKHTLTAVYEGTTIYKSSNQTTSFVVSEDKSSVVASNLNAVYATGAYYKIIVYGTDGKLANNAKVVVTVKGKQLVKPLTTKNGVAMFKVTQVPGSYKMVITSLGKSVTRTLTVKHLVTLKTVAVKKSAKKLVLQATLGKVNGKYLKNKWVTFKFNGVKYLGKTNKKGVAKVVIKNAKSGKNTYNFAKLKAGKKIKYQATFLKDTVIKTVKVKK